MQSQLNSIHLELKSKESLTTEIDRMNRTIMERDMNLISIRDELTHEKQKRNSEQETNRRLTRSLRKKQEEIKTKEKEIEGLRSEIQERDKRVSIKVSITHCSAINVYFFFHSWACRRPNSGH